MRELIRPSVSVIVPAYNEEEAVGPQVEAIRDVLSAEGFEYEILVVDDGSSDRTSEHAFQAGARVLRQPYNRGYGASLKAGILAARYDYTVIIDADLTYPAAEIPVLVAKLATADMVVGARVGTDVHIPLLRRPAKWMLGRLASQIAGRPIPDLNSGLRAFRRSCVQQYFPILSNRFSFTTTVTLAFLADDYQVVYHPINYYQRTGQSKITPRHFMDFIILVLRMAMLFQPLRVFAPLAVTCLALGTAKAVFDLVALFARHAAIGWYLLYEPTLSISAMLLFMTALQLFLIGMVADGVVRRIGQHNGPPVPSYGLYVSEAYLDARPARPDGVFDR